MILKEKKKRPETAKPLRPQSPTIRNNILKNSHTPIFQSQQNFYIPIEKEPFLGDSNTFEHEYVQYKENPLIMNLKNKFNHGTTFANKSITNFNKSNKHKNYNFDYYSLLYWFSAA